MRLLFFLLFFCSVSLVAQFHNDEITVGAERMEQYLPMLQSKRVALVVNQTSLVNNTHLADTLLSKGVNVVRIFAPEHGFRGTADAGETVKNGIDVQTDLPVVSLYGKNKKPTAEQLKGIDIVVFDIQDVGARFYTYISTMHYVMEACAENNKKCIVLDRPNPNGHYVAGPILNSELKSFVGMHPIPVVHGLTVGELACIINEEGWLNNGISCNLEVIKCSGYDHKKFYRLPIAPSPNLPNMESVYLYPHLCFFEGTVVSVGRGTDFPFQVIGHPQIKEGSFTFSPESKAGAKYPKLQGKTCFGEYLGSMSWDEFQGLTDLDLGWLVNYYGQLNKNDESFFLTSNFIDKLAGTKDLRLEIMAGKSAKTIQAKWMQDLDAYKLLRQKYLLYEDF